MPYDEVCYQKIEEEEENIKEKKIQDYKIKTREENISMIIFLSLADLILTLVVRLYLTV